MNPSTNVVRLRQPNEVDDPLTEVLRAGARRLLAQAVELEAEAFLAGMRDLTLPDGRARLVRHGRSPERMIQTGIGPVAVSRVKVRDRGATGVADRVRFASTILPRWARRTRSLDALLPVLYLRGVSTGDFQEALAALLGTDAPNLSPSVIARLTAKWRAEYERWQERDLSIGRYVYVWADGVYLQARMEEQAECMLVLIGATPEGRKELVGFQVGVRESAQSWRELLVEMKRRGLTIAPELAVGDGALGFWKALDAIYPGTRHQRCWVHTIRTQLRSGLPWAVSARLRGAQWDDMADLQTAVADDDALDDELQDRLLVGERRLVQAGVNAITKRLQAGANGLGLEALATEVIALLLLALQGQALVSQLVAPLRQLGQGHRAGLVGVQ
jgi:putative transposase